MEDKKIEISIKKLILIIVVLVVIMIAIILSTNKENSKTESVLHNSIGNLSESVYENESIKNADNNVANLVENEIKTNNSSANAENIIDNITSINSNTTTSTKGDNIEKNTTSASNEIVGTWNTYRISEISTGKEITNLVEIFGTSYINLGSYLQLNEDGTFVNSIRPVTDGSQSVKGTYTIENNYLKSGDCYVSLNYDDGRTEMFQRIYYDDTNVPTLTITDDNYQYDLQK